MPDMPFGEVMGTFGKSILLEAKASSIISNSKMPASEVRDFLRSGAEARDGKLIAYLKEATEKVGIGKLSFEGVERFKYTFKVEDCKVHNIYPWDEKGKVCSITVNFLNRFFSKNLELPCDVEEIKCVADGDGSCSFLVTLQPLEALVRMLDIKDRDILAKLDSGEGLTEKEKERSGMLEDYGLIEEGKLTESGEASLKYLTAAPKKEEKVKPPWEKKKIPMEIAVEDLFDKAFEAAFGK